MRDNSKDPNIILGVREDGSYALQAFRYKVDQWTEAKARKHCQEHKGNFEPALPEEETMSKRQSLQECMSDPDMIDEYPDESDRRRACQEMSSGRCHSCREVRAWPLAKLRAETTPDNKPKIVGLAAVYNSLSEDLGGFREKIRPGAFDASIQRGDDIRALINHDPTLILGRNKSGTLKLETDGDGLQVSIEPPDTTYALDLLKSISRGDVSGMSFSFTTSDDRCRWSVENGQPIRELIDADLYDVSVVTYPAYIDTQVALRSLSSWKEQEKRGAVPYAATPTIDPETWDAEASEARVRSWASTGDSIDWAKYRRAFAWYDSADPNMLGAYKLLHHDIRDGALVAVRRGVIAAMTVVLGGRGGVDIPDADMEAVYGHLARHYEQYNMEPPEFHRSAVRPPEAGLSVQMANYSRRARVVEVLEKI